MIDTTPIPRAEHATYRARALAGDRRALERLVASFERMVIQRVSRWTAYAHVHDDLAQEARLAAYHAIWRWDPSRGPLGPYLRTSIDHALAHHVGRDRRHWSTSLDELVGEDHATRHELIADDTADLPLGAAMRADDCRRIDAALQTLSARSEWVVRALYGIPCDPATELTWRRTGSEIQDERLRQVEALAVQEFGALGRPTTPRHPSKIISGHGQQVRAPRSVSK